MVKLTVIQELLKFYQKYSWSIMKLSGSQSPQTFALANRYNNKENFISSVAIFFSADYKNTH